MTNREKEILALLRQNPLISQQEAADVLGITRSSVGVHISNLMQKGAIRGKGYILSEESRIAVIGGANLDIYGFPTAELVPGVSNPGRVETACGGVGRNIAENLARLGAPVSLLTALGQDASGERLRQGCAAAGVDMSHSIISPRYPTSTYLALQDGRGDMAWAVSQMDIMGEMTVDNLRKEEAWLEQAAALVLDANLPEAALSWLAHRYRHLPLWVDPVSIEKSKKLKSSLDCFYAIKPNRQEAALLSGIPAEGREGVLANWHYFMKAGISELWLSLGADGLFFGNRQGGFFARPPEVSLVNANGAGDALMAGAVAATQAGLGSEDRVRSALAAAALTCTASDTIHPDLSETKIKSMMHEVTIDETIS